MSEQPPSSPELPSFELERVIEAVLFAHDGIVTIEMLAEALPGIEAKAVRAAITALGREYEQSGRSFELVRVAGGFQICTRERWASWVVRVQRGGRRARLSRAAVETLAIIAYRQPITRTAMEEIRGVDSGAVLHTLLERNLATVKGRGKGLGRPLLYGTTPEFLEYFGLDRLEDLPRLDEIESLLKERESEERIDDPGNASPGAEAPAATGEEVGAIDSASPAVGEDMEGSGTIP